jgi:hypothetical protein
LEVSNILNTPPGHADVPVPESFVYYDDLDTARFASPAQPDRFAWTAADAREQALIAMGNVMLGFIVGNTGLILSRSQAHDNSLLLELLNPEGDRASRDDRLAFLNLITKGFVRVGILDSGLDDSPPDGERHSVLNVFRTYLRNHDIVFSGWPELTDEPQLRTDIVDCLDSDPSGGGLSGLLTADLADLAARIEGLLEFDRVLRRTRGAIKPVASSSGAPLGARIMQTLSSLPDDRRSVQDLASIAIEHARKDDINLNYRSNWYRLIDEHGKRDKSKLSPAAITLKEVVDSNWNAEVSSSFNAGQLLSAKDRGVAVGLADRYTPGLAPGWEWAELLPDRQHRWLRLSDVPDLLATLQVLSPAGRLRELEDRRTEWIAQYDAQHRWGSSVRIALPFAALSTSIALAEGAAAAETVQRAALAAGISGAATLVAGTPVAKMLTSRNLAREEGRLIASRSTVRAGAAGWLERLRPGRD